MESTVDEELANFRQSREEQDQEYAESLDETKVFVYDMHFIQLYIMFIYFT